MAIELADQIYLLELPLPFAVNMFQPHAVGSINLYLIRDGSRLMLVDCGMSCAASWEILKAEFNSLGLEFSQLTDIVITHTHIDHIGMLDQLIALAPQATVHIHQLELNLLTQQQLAPSLVARQFQVWDDLNGLHVHEASGYAASEVNLAGFIRNSATHSHILTGNGTVKLESQTWELLWTPGHAPGHLALYNRASRVLISGDHLFATTSSSVTRFPGSAQNPLADYLTSLEQLGRLDVQLILPGHGPSFTNLTEVLTKVGRQHRRKIDRVREALSEGLKTPYQITQELWRDALNPVTYRLALSGTLSYIEWLVDRGEVVSQLYNGVTYLEGCQKPGLVLASVK